MLTQMTPLQQSTGPFSLTIDALGDLLEGLPPKYSLLVLTVLSVVGLQANQAFLHPSWLLCIPCTLQLRLLSCVVSRRGRCDYAKFSACLLCILTFI